MFFDSDMDFPAYLRKLSDNMIETLSNIDSEKGLRTEDEDVTEDVNVDDKYQKRGRILMESSAIQSIDYQSSIVDSHEAENYAREYQKLTDKFNKKWKQKELTKQLIPSTFPDPIPSSKNLMYKKSKDNARKRALTGREAADALEINKVRER